MHEFAPQPPQPARVLIELLAIAAVGTIVARAGIDLARGAPAAASAALSSPGQRDLCESLDDAYLSGTVYGAVERAIEWRGTDMTCQGGPRPNGDGVRLVFAAPGSADGGPLVFVIGISGALGELTDTERAANVTLIDESSGRFFSTGQQERCWTTVTSVADEDDRISVGGEFYCAGSLPSLSDGSSVSLRDFRYSGRLMLDAS